MDDDEQLTTSSLVVGIILETLSLIGLAASAFVLCLLIYFKYASKDPPMLLVANLLICDLGHLSLVVFYTGPSMIISDQTDMFNFLTSDSAKKFVSACTLLFWCSSLTFLSFMSATRLFAVCYPLRLKITFTKRHIVIIATASWLICILVPMVLAVSRTECCFQPFEFIDMLDVESDEVSENVDFLFISVQTLTIAVVLWTLYCYIRIGFKLWSLKNTTVNNESREYRQLTAQFVGMSVLFLTHCMLNFLSGVLLNDIHLLMVSKILYVLNSCVAPFVIMLSNKGLKSNVKKLFGKCICRKQTNAVSILVTFTVQQ